MDNQETLKKLHNKIVNLYSTATNPKRPEWINGFEHCRKLILTLIIKEIQLLKNHKEVDRMFAVMKKIKEEYPGIFEEESKEGICNYCGHNVLLHTRKNDGCLGDSFDCECKGFI
jgi:DNA-directed RNA polymerase subunit RPC12/RpoP